MPNCPKCNKPVYFAERKQSMGKEWHANCLRCSNAPCNKVLAPGSHAEHEGQPYCTQCHRSLFGPKGYGHGGGESHTFHEQHTN